MGIATLAQVIAEPQLITSLDLGEKYPYRVRAADFGTVVALIDASPPFLSQRMMLVEQALDAADQMILSYSAANAKRELDGCEGLQDVRLWAVPYEASMYQQAHAILLSRDPARQWQEFLDHGVFQGLSVLVRGRREHLLGQFAKHGDDLGAMGFYLAARMSNARIEGIEKDKELQKMVGLERTIDTTDREWEQRISQVKRLQVESKKNASYWLGLTHMEQRDYDVAINWLKVRTLRQRSGRTVETRRTLQLAHCYEALGRTEEARQLYLIDDSPQRHGCLLRARQLETPGEVESSKE